MPFLSRLTSRFSGSGSLVYTATSDDSACPTSRQLYQISALTYKSTACKDIFTSLEKRLKSGSRHWRNVSKALSVFKYLILHGSPAVLTWMSCQVPQLNQLLQFQAPREDASKTIRDQATLLIELIESPEKRAQEKELYDRTREAVRTSMGRSSVSRNTLEYVRSMDEDSEEYLDREGGRLSMSRLSLGAIEEE